MPSFQREVALGSMAASRYDVVVIGAGMTGAGVALDAASRGLRVALVEAGDIASGTSSKSSKMVHGGLRYLRQREFRLVYENLRERQRLLDNAPFLVRPLPFLIPLFAHNGVLSRALVRGYATALRLYDLAGGWRLGRHRRISKAEALAHLPTLNIERLVAGFLYLDARGDDARIALALARTAALDYDVDVANYLRATGVTYDANGRVSGVMCRDEISGVAHALATRAVVNATGVWADDIAAMAQQHGLHRVTPAKGVHLSVPSSRLPADVAAVLNVPGDRRSIFIVPFEEVPYTFIGTTDTAYAGPLDQPVCSPDDVAYLLNAVNQSTSSELIPQDVTGVWAGLRPLLAPPEGKRLSARTADLSRRHQVIDSGDGVVHVTGGKWTTYRQMAEDGVDALRPYFADLASVQTKKLRLHGTGEWRPHTPLEQHLYQRYGQEALSLIGLINERPELGDRPIRDQPYVSAEFIFAVRHEMATSLVDLVTRRTRAHLHDARATLRAAETIATLVAPELGWSLERCQREVAEYRAMVHHEFSAAGLTL